MISASTGIDYRYAQESVVPEPGGAALGLAALAGLGTLRSRRRMAS